MNVINHNDASHTIRVIPRRYCVGALTLELRDEYTKTTTTPTPTFYFDSGYLYLTFALTAGENDKYRVKITDTSGVIYRGKIIATAQSTQEYELNPTAYRYD